METDKTVRPAAAIAATAARHPGKVMLISPQRVVYAGLPGRMQTRELGAFAIYVALDNPFSVQVEGGQWRSARMWVAQPELPHRIATSDRMIGVYVIEPECVDAARLPAFLRNANRDQDYPALYRRMRTAFGALIEGRVDAEAVRARGDAFFLGQTLVPRTLEPRVAAVVDRIVRSPCENVGAEQFAAELELSFSRFLHLFKAEVGVAFRRFRAWKRARGFLAYVNTPLNLTDIALETGYPDSSHFSHTIRRYLGLTPRDIIAGSRRLAVITDGGDRPARPGA